MGEETPGSDQSGIERRDVLKGLGFGAAGLAGAGAATSATAQDAQQPSPGNLAIDYVKVVPETAEPEVNQNTYVDRPWATADLVFGLNFAPQDGKNVLDGPIPIGYQFTVVHQQTRQPVTESFEEGRCMCFAGSVDIAPGGGTEGRETFSLSGLGPDQPDQSPNAYFAVLTVTDYRGNLDPVLGSDAFEVADQPAQQNGGGGNGGDGPQTETPTQTPEGGDGAGGGGNGGAGGTPTPEGEPAGNQTAGNESA